jgi:selenocysteine lyase/cysteine desulfurase
MMPEDQELYHLFAFPLECNFSGAKFDLDLVTQIQQGRHCGEKHSGQWLVLVDAAKGCGTMPPDLSRFKADFVAISFYKLFGYPTGLGALLVRNGKHKIHIPWLYGSSYSCQGKTNLVAPFKFPEITDRYAEPMFWVV